MDYFSELLESYTKLKKRTFKLTYINEEDEVKEPDGAQTPEGNQAAEAAAQDAIANAPEQASDDSSAGAGGDVTLVNGEISNSLKIYVGVGKAKGTKTAQESESYGTVKVWGLPSNGRPSWRSVQAGPNATESVKKNSVDARKLFVKALGSDNTEMTSADEKVQSDAEMEQEAEQARLDGITAMQGQHGGTLELLGHDGDEIKGVVAALDRSAASVKKMCDSHPEAVKKDPQMQKLCDSPGTYIGGMGAAAFERKLANMQGVRTGDRGFFEQESEINRHGQGFGAGLDGETVRGESGPETKQEGTFDPKANRRDDDPALLDKPSAELVEEIAESHAALTDFLNCSPEAKGNAAAALGPNPDSCNCAGMQFRVGKVDDKMLFFGQDTREGMAIAPNALQNLAFTMMKDKCGTTDDAYTQVYAKAVNGKAINAIKGTMNELIMLIGVQLNKAENTEDTLKIMRESGIIEQIEKRRRLLKEYAATQAVEEDVALDFDANFEESVLLEQAGIASDPVQMQNWFLTELRYQRAFIKAVDADGARKAGKEGGTGNRADTELLYTNDKEGKARLERACAQLDIPVPKDDIDDESGMLKLGVGQKRLISTGKVKQGEIGKISRQRAIMSGEVDAADSDFDPRFYAKMQKMQYGGDKANGSDREEKALAFYDEVENKIEADTSGLTETSTYTNSNGDTKIQTPASVIEGLVDIVRAALPFSEISKQSKGPLADAMFDEKGKARDFTTNTNQRRLREVASRDARFYMYSEAINGDDPKKAQAAKDALVKSALISGANATPLTQVITDNTGATASINHNGPLQSICDANNADPSTLEVNISGHTVTLTTPGPPKTKVTYGQTRESTGPKGSDERQAETRSETSIDAETVQAFNRVDSLTPATSDEAGIEDSTIEKFLKGQMKLLETLLK